MFGPLRQEILVNLWERLACEAGCGLMELLRGGQPPGSDALGHF